MKKILVSILLFIPLILIVTLSFGHSGRTDSNGGHYNRSTGEYHYHHGYSEHQHPNGICPYESVTEDEPMVFTDTQDNYQSSTLQNQVDRSQNEIYRKQDTIGELNNTIAVKIAEIKRLEANTTTTHIIYITVIISIFIYLYYLYGNRKKLEKELSKYKYNSDISKNDEK